MATGRSQSPESPSPNSRSDKINDGPSYKSAVSDLIKEIKKLADSKVKMRDADNTKIIQVANIAPQANKDQMYALFGNIGQIDDLRLYPAVELGFRFSSKICFVKFHESSCVGIAQHMTNTVFIDRALIVVPYTEGDIPDEQKSLELLSSGTLLPGIADPKLPQYVTSHLEGVAPYQVVITTDSKLIERNLPLYPPLPPTYDTRKIEEIRRTVMVANVDSELKATDLIDYFGLAGEIKYFRFCTRDNDPLHYVLIEFTEQPSVLNALHLNGTKLGTKIIKVFHSTQAIIKPQAKTNEAAQKEIEEAMASQSHTLLIQGLDGPGKDSRREKSRRRRRSRSRSRGRVVRLRSRSRSISRSRSRIPFRRLRSPSPHRDRVRRSNSNKDKSRSSSRNSSLSKKRSRNGRKKSRSASRTKKSRSRSISKKSEEKKKSKRDDKKKSKGDKDREKKIKVKGKDEDIDKLI